MSKRLLKIGEMDEAKKLIKQLKAKKTELIFQKKKQDYIIKQCEQIDSSTNNGMVSELMTVVHNEMNGFVSNIKSELKDQVKKETELDFLWDKYREKFNNKSKAEVNDILEEFKQDEDIENDELDEELEKYK